MRHALPRTLLVALLAVGLSACDTTEEPESTITDLVVASSNLSTLEAAVVRAGLADDLAGDGPFTVFAPTDDAFADLLAALDATPEELLARDDLGAILTFHVIAGSELQAADLSAGQSARTLNGASIGVVAAGSGLGIDTDGDGSADARVTTTDIEASNGVVHLIDAVLLP